MYKTEAFANDDEKLKKMYVELFAPKEYNIDEKHLWGMGLVS